ncbi:MAG: hypothetical protein GXP49_16385 [Deltaproteobacteria bacterium]|nr:hypothetical protein [Deltaproteobacteria bacterium]
MKFDSSKVKMLCFFLAAFFVVPAGTTLARSKRHKHKHVQKKKKKDPFNNISRIIKKEALIDAMKKLAEDERVPIASSTLVEKGRGEEYYGVDKLLDRNPDTFWAEGAKGWGKNEWIAFYLPEGTTHIEITPGAGKEQFSNFNRPRKVYVDVYLVKIVRNTRTDKIEPKFKWMGRTVVYFKDKPRTVRKKLSVKLEELAMTERTMYVGVMFIRKVYKGQFDDTAISELHTTSIWGEE